MLMNEINPIYMCVKKSRMDFVKKTQWLHPFKKTNY